jgi:hypothetical protein
LAQLLAQWQAELPAGLGQAWLVDWLLAWQARVPVPERQVVHL